MANKRVKTLLAVSCYCPETCGSELKHRQDEPLMECTCKGCTYYGIVFFRPTIEIEMATNKASEPVPYDPNLIRRLASPTTLVSGTPSE